MRPDARSTTARAVGRGLTVLLAATALSACDRPFVPVAAPQIEVLQPDTTLIQTVREVRVQIRATSFRPVARVTIDGVDMRPVGDDRFETDLVLEPGENRRVVTAFDEEAVPGVDTLRLVFRTLQVAAGPVWDPPMGAMSITPVADGTYLLMGGAPSDTARASARITRFDPERGTFAPIAEMAHARAGHTVTRLPDGRLLIVGGSRIGRPRTVADLVETVEWFDPGARTGGEWPTEGDPVRRAGHTAEMRRRPDGVVLDLIGGWGDVQYRPSSEFGVRGDLRSFRFDDERLRAIHPAPGPYAERLAGHTQTALAAFEPGENGPWLVTGAAPGAEPHTLRWDTSHPAGIDVMDLREPVPPVNEHAAVRLPNGHVLLIGGVPANETIPKALVSIYVPAFGRFLAYPAGPSETLRARRAQGVTFLPDGRILVMGGFSPLGTADGTTEYLTLN